MPALHQDLNRAPLLRLVDLRADLLEGQNVRFVILGPAIKRAELAIRDAQVGVVDVAVNDVADHVRRRFLEPQRMRPRAQLEQWRRPHGFDPLADLGAKGTIAQRRRDVLRFLGMTPKANGAGGRGFPPAGCYGGQNGQLQRSILNFFRDPPRPLTTEFTEITETAKKNKKRNKKPKQNKSREQLHHVNATGKLRVLRVLRG